MANQEHLAIIKRGVKSWNDWRRKNFKVIPDLSGSDLNGAHLRQANLRMADISKAHLSRADLRKSDLSVANLKEANLTEANLSRADLRMADLQSVDLRGANVSGAYLNGAHLDRADLSGANLSGAELREISLNKARLHATDLHEADLYGAYLEWTDLSGANLNETYLSRSNIGGTTFANNDLSAVYGLEIVNHHEPSTIGINTLARSKNLIPASFLRGCGLSDWQIEAAKLYQPDLTNEALGDILYRIHDLRAQRPLQINPLFISYSHDDSPFIEYLEHYLVQAGIRFWRDVHHGMAGRLERQVDRAMRLNPTVLLILSEHSVKSDWVEHEARLARKLEKEFGRDVLCPIALDSSWKKCRWPERLREQIMEYNILDFSRWQDESYFDRMYRKLIEGLNLFYEVQGG